MDSLEGREKLYRETLNNASIELRELSCEIACMRRMLSQLERRREAVAQLCDALGTWIELSSAETPHPDAHEEEAAGQHPPQGLRLTEEEVSSLIAYPGSARRSA